MQALPDRPPPNAKRIGRRDRPDHQKMHRLYRRLSPEPFRAFPFTQKQTYPYVFPLNFAFYRRGRINYRLKIKTKIGPFLTEIA